MCRAGSVMIRIPVQKLSNAKQRLAIVIDDGIRNASSHAMIQDVLETVQSWRKESDGSTVVALVTSDPYAEEVGRALDFDMIRDETNPGETGAIEMATRLCESRGVKSTLVIPGDIPLLAA